MNKSLFNIREDAIQLYNKIELAEGEITEELELALKINENELEQKATSYVGLIKTIDSEINAAKEEVKRLNAIIKRNNNINNRLKFNIKEAMNTYGIDEIKSNLITINFRKSESVVINDVQSLPSVCQVVKVEPISKTEIKKMIKNGEEVPGAEIQTNYNIQIK